MNFEILAQYPPSKTFQAYVIGDVRPIIYSRASDLMRLPESVSHGLGALTHHGPETSGEGIVFRGQVGLTPPTPNAGIDFKYPLSPAAVQTPFFLGWRGAPLLLGRFWEPEFVTLRQIYQEALGVLARAGGGCSSVVFLEILGLLPVNTIQDRALKKPVHTGYVQITSSENAPGYFNAEMIRADFARRGQSASQLIPAGIVGVAINPNDVSPWIQRLNQSVFYNPPQLNQPSTLHISSSLKTHSHAIAWRERVELNHALTLACQSPIPPNLESMEAVLIPSVLQHSPDYLVHLDEDTQLMAGWVQIYGLASPHDLFFAEG